MNKVAFVGIIVSTVLQLNAFDVFEHMKKMHELFEKQHQEMAEVFARMDAQLGEQKQHAGQIEMVDEADMLKIICRLGDVSEEDAEINVEVDDDNRLVVRVTAPSKKMFITIDGRYITVRSEARNSTDKSRAHSVFQSISSQTMTLPVAVNVQEAKPIYKNGTLELHLPHKSAKKLTIVRE